MPDPTKRTTEWRCEKCGAVNRVTYDDDASLYEVVSAIVDSHKRDAPGCVFDLASVRVSEVPA
jgi:hypothetical protein